MTPSTQILNEAKECFKGARQNLIKGAGLLYEISEKELWREQYDSFEDYIEQECHIGASMASKLIAVWRGYHVEGSLAAKLLHGVDSEKLYLALRLPGSPEKKLASAQTLTRQEIKANLRDEKNGGPCTHEGESYETWRKYPCGEWVRQ